MQIVTQPIALDTFNLTGNERRLCVEALSAAGNLVGAAKLPHHPSLDEATYHQARPRLDSPPRQLLPPSLRRIAPVAAHAA
ncbi:hypothetical protein [Nannocystis sp.]|uniref:hypothetical protein n=1 Tax=Nannocystis sp. TaxID=1962667 RepID=UPI0025EE6DE2|nr:hypothetical protein [Nannocystis sp.]MBK7823694.1 hypothetical protein [Nannocystis sp.]